MCYTVLPAMKKFLPGFVLLAVACGGTPDDSTDSSTSNLTEVDQAGIDAQVLQIWTPGKLFPESNPGGWLGVKATDYKLDAATACTTTRTNTWSHWEDREVDCTDAFAKAVPFDVTKTAGPALTPVHFTVSKDTAGSAVYVDPDFCNVVELRLVVRDAAAASPTFSGIGFYTSRGNVFANKGDLQAVGHARLKNGDDATVYRFAGISTCISGAHNSTSGNMYQTFSFKPYAAFDVDGTRYKVWEKINGNHTIGHSWPGSQPQINAEGFDRQHDLLAD
jgi:hypothetical protein